MVFIYTFKIFVNLLKSLDYEVIENELFCEEEQKKGYKYIVHKDFARWMTFFWIGVITAFAGITISISIEIGTTFKFDIIKKCILFIEIIFTLEIILY